MPLWTCSTIYHHRNFAILARNTHQHPGPQGLPLSPPLHRRLLLLLPHLLLRRPSRHGHRWSGRRKRRPLHHQQSLHQLQPHPQQHPKPLPPRRASPYPSADSSLRETAHLYPPVPSPLGTASTLPYRLLSSNASSAIQQTTSYLSPWTRLRLPRLTARSVSSFTSSLVPLQSTWTRLLHSSLCTTYLHPTLLPTSAENSPLSTLGLFSRINPDGSAQKKSDKGNAPPLSSSPLPAPRHRTLLCYHACQASPPTTDLRDTSVSTRLPNASTVTSSAIIPLNAPTPQPVAGAPNHTLPGTTPVPQQPAPPEAASVHTLHHCVSTATGLTNHTQPPVQSVRFRRPEKGMATTTAKRWRALRE